MKKQVIWRDYQEDPHTAAIYRRTAGLNRNNITDAEKSRLRAISSGINGDSYANAEMAEFPPELKWYEDWMKRTSG